jgi:sec-independent protein translocase protein TatA
MGRIGGGELLLILAVALLIFGPSKLADLGKGLGEGLKNFKRGMSDEDAKRAKPDGSPVATAPAELPPTEPGKPPSTIN